jgi:hypothetical protein
MDDYRCWIETAPPGSTEWQRYEGIEEDAEPPGMYLAEKGTCDGLDGLAQKVLRDHLIMVLRSHADQPDLQVRACAETCDPTVAAPAVIHEASPHALAKARQIVRREALTRHLTSACDDVYDARRSLEAAIVHAHRERLDRKVIARTVKSLVDAEEVAHIIDAPVLFREVRKLIRTRPELAWRIAMHRGPMPDVTVELRWSNEDCEAEQLRETAWNESIEEYDEELAATLLADARRVAGELLTLLSTQFEVTPTTPDAIAPRILTYHPIRVRRPCQ